ncbi:MAG: ATP-binding cassette domain-containing protein [Comamonadaceae bacterium]|jgi:phospholipid/cholesterol/gamma-HCH transport system ATP-binding protein|uniref:ATP-binding cassette domain-containing protein n=1 Tax=Hydrogenophaga borbori TaxID=2294117 RepID=A0A372EK24_9BURK|nr:MULTISPECIES: ATP-binding cassette domain-containing protein [Hydrogenophaga]NCT97918.1 ATP-binding cassette domain-containing protein [Comamonadaceae bacterium]RFP79282.1 ATP-binding cassette domain-containing protein [Hydrogenophaga borbori]WQB84305.1 ATP-binding cassette domain-containing protein [Hydrogenophaga sp. SNF1]
MAALLSVQDLEMRFGDRLIQRGISFDVEAGRIFAIMGGSGCGKSTLLKHLVGLLPPASGTVRHGGVDYWASGEAEREAMRLKFGMLFQSAALWSSMTVLDNVCLALARQTALDARAQEARAREVLAWVGLDHAADQMPAQLSGGMKKRAGLARAIAAEPPLLFLDEPSAGLDPISSRRLDDLILDIRQRTGAAVVLVSHELPSLFAIADDGLFLDADSKTPIARGCPRELARAHVHPTVDAFLRREAPPDPPAPSARGDSA